MPLVSRTRAILRSAEFGFFGVIVDTRVHTPRFCGAPWSAGVLVFSRLDVRPLRISWLTVGIGTVPSRLRGKKGRYARKPGKGRGPAEPDTHGSRGEGAVKPAPPGGCPPRGCR